MSLCSSPGRASNGTFTRARAIKSHIRLRSTRPGGSENQVNWKETTSQSGAKRELVRSLVLAPPTESWRMRASERARDRSASTQRKAIKFLLFACKRPPLSTAGPAGLFWSPFSGELCLCRGSWLVGGPQASAKALGDGNNCAHVIVSSVNHTRPPLRRHRHDTSHLTRAQRAAPGGERQHTHNSAQSWLRTSIIIIIIFAL